MELEYLKGPFSCSGFQNPHHESAGGSTPTIKNKFSTQCSSSSELQRSAGSDRISPATGSAIKSRGGWKRKSVIDGAREGRRTRIAPVFINRGHSTQQLQGKVSLWHLGCPPASAPAGPHTGPWRRGRSSAQPEPEAVAWQDLGEWGMGIFLGEWLVSTSLVYRARLWLDDVGNVRLKSCSGDFKSFG